MPAALRWLGTVMIAALVVLTGCSESDSSDATSTESAGQTTVPETSTVAEASSTTSEAATSTTAESTTTTAPTSTTIAPTTTAAPTPADVDAICDAYLDFASARSPEDRGGPVDAISAALGDEGTPELADALSTVATADFGSQDVRPQLGVLRDFVLPRCGEQYGSGLTPAVDDDTATNEFYAALVSGDRDTARTLADALTVALFEPWDAPSDPGELVPTEGGFWLSSIEFGQASCEVNGGLVTRCGFG